MKTSHGARYRAVAALLLIVSPFLTPSAGAMIPLQEAGRGHSVGNVAEPADASSQDADAGAPAVDLYLSKDQLSGINKDTKKLYERCVGSKKYGSGDGKACADFGHAYQNGGKDPSVPVLAYKRGCSLGSAWGCGSLADVAKADGNLDKARELWSTGPCAKDAGCQHMLFASYAEAAPPDVTNAVKIGLPLCDEGHDDKVCDQLKAINAPVDFNQIAANHKQQRILWLIDHIGKNNLANIALQGQVSLNQTNVNMQSGFAQLLAKGELALAKKELSESQKQGAAMQAELDQLQGTQTATAPPQ